MTDANVYALDRWLDTMRSPNGYGGPVAHWWQQSLMFCGAGFDWRYEGIIAGYLALWRRTSDQQWLEKACRAGDDLVAAQSADSHFPNSGFERNPSTAGTPHEVACTIGLLRLAEALQATSKAFKTSEVYIRCAEHNLQSFYIGLLWDEEQQRFRDGIGTETFVPNKAATACEAFFLWAKLRKREALVEQFVLPTLNHILNHQITGTGKLHGAIAQNSLNQQRIEKFFPIYIARCIPALLQGYEWTNDERFVVAAQAAIAFIMRWQQADGTLPTVIYHDGAINRGHIWRAGLGDILRAAELLRPYNFDAPLHLHEVFNASQDTTGGFQTASGFAAQTGGKLSDLPDIRDVLHVVGWNDKAFRYLAEFGSLEAPIHVESSTFACDCIFRGQQMHFKETPSAITVRAKQKTVYHWQKGTDYPEIASSDFWLR